MEICLFPISLKFALAEMTKCTNEIYIARFKGVAFSFHSIGFPLEITLHWVWKFTASAPIFHLFTFDQWCGPWWRPPDWTIEHLKGLVIWKSIWKTKWRKLFSILAGRTLIFPSFKKDRGLVSWIGVILMRASDSSNVNWCLIKWWIWVDSSHKDWGLMGWLGWTGCFQGDWSLE